MKYWTIKSYDELISKYSYNSARLFNAYKTGDKIALMSATLEELEELIQVLLIVREEIKDFFNDNKNTTVIDNLLEYVNTLIH